MKQNVYNFVLGETVKKKSKRTFKAYLQRKKQLTSGGVLVLFCFKILWQKKGTFYLGNFGNVRTRFGVLSVQCKQFCQDQRAVFAALRTQWRPGCRTVFGCEWQAFWSRAVSFHHLPQAPWQQTSIENSLGIWHCSKLQKNKSGRLDSFFPHQFFFLLPRLESITFQKNSSLHSHPLALTTELGNRRWQQCVFGVLGGEGFLKTLLALSDSTESNFKPSS